VPVSVNWESEREKLKQIKQKQPRPAYADYVQTPQVNVVILRKMSVTARAKDFMLQKAHSNYGTALVPIHRAMEALQKGDSSTVRENIGDAFKLLSTAIATTTQMRQEIKRDRLPIFRQICSYAPSPTFLSGDKIEDEIGGKIKSLDTISRTLWKWCIERDITLTAYHIIGKMNTTADTTLDLFASRINAKSEKYCSRLPDQRATAIDEFSFEWSSYEYYAFPPFSIISRILQKVQHNETELLLLIAPLWPAQIWYPILIQMIVQPCLLLLVPQKILSLEHCP